MTWNGWAVALNGVVLSGSRYADQTAFDQMLIDNACAEIAASDDYPYVVFDCLTEPPDGLGLPPRRIETVTFAQRDGVKQYASWYGQRLITLKVMICSDNCPGCAQKGAPVGNIIGFGEDPEGFGTWPFGGTSTGGTTGYSARQKVQKVLKAWDRDCCDAEIVIFTDCHGTLSPIPVGVKGEGVLTRTNLALNPRAVEGGEDGEWTPAIGGWDLNWIVGVTSPADLEDDEVVTARRATQNAGAVTEAAGFNIACTTLGSTPGTTGDWLLHPVEAGLDYVVSGYLQSPTTVLTEAQVDIRFHDGAGNWISTIQSGTPVGPTIPNDWVRVDHLATAPASGYLAARLLIPSQAWDLGDMVDGTGLMIELASELSDYFDGDTPNTDSDLGQLQYEWEEGAENSKSFEYLYTYDYEDRAVNGPFGIKGRPGEALVTWVGQGSKCAELTLRFDGNDQRMSVLDSCGTPGYTSCVNVQPGTVILTRCVGEEQCYPKCYDTVAPGSQTVAPTKLTVGGTECVYPIITLFPALTSPRVENLTTGDFIVYAGTVIGDPVIINTEDMTASQGGVSVTHLISGTPSFSFAEPGDYEVRLQAGSLQDDGFMSVCWRDTVVSA